MTFLEKMNAQQSAADSQGYVLRRLETISITVVSTDDIQVLSS